jgi:hypothetical protein
MSLKIDLVKVENTNIENPKNQISEDKKEKADKLLLEKISFLGSE